VPDWEKRELRKNIQSYYNRKLINPITFDKPTFFIVHKLDKKIKNRNPLNYDLNNYTIFFQPTKLKNIENKMMLEATKKKSV
jgi:hypothetical protein